jgi:hypothetical protein
MKKLRTQLAALKRCLENVPTPKRIARPKEVNLQSTEETAADGFEGSLGNEGSMPNDGSLLDASARKCQAGGTSTCRRFEDEDRVTSNARDADASPKQSVSGEGREQKGKPKLKRSKALGKQKSTRKKKQPQSGSMVSLAMALAMAAAAVAVAFVIAALVTAGMPLSSPRYHHANMNGEFNLYVTYTGCEQADEHYANVGTTRLGPVTRVLLVDDDFVNALPTDKHACASRSVSSPFHMITTLPYASVPLEPVARAEGGDQCDRELRAKDARNRVNEERLKALIKANGEMLEEKENTIRLQQEELQENSRMARAHHSSRVTRGQPTPSRSARRKFRRTSSLISSSHRPLYTPTRTYVEGQCSFGKGCRWQYQWMWAAATTRQAASHRPPPLHPPPRARRFGTRSSTGRSQHGKRARPWS